MLHKIVLLIVTHHLDLLPLKRHSGKILFILNVFENVCRAVRKSPLEHIDAWLTWHLLEQSVFKQWQPSYKAVPCPTNLLQLVCSHQSLEEVWKLHDCENMKVNASMYCKSSICTKWDRTKKMQWTVCRSNRIWVLLLYSSWIEWSPWLFCLVYFFKLFNYYSFNEWIICM